MIFFSALGALILFTQPAAAESDLYLFGGAQDPGKVTLNKALSGGSVGSQLITDPTSVGVFGARVGHGKAWGGEFTFAYAPNFLDSNSKAVIYNSDLRVLIPLPVIQPYGVVGVGAITSWGSGASDIGTRFAINYGGGVRIIPAGPIGVQFDVRGYTIPSVQDQVLNIAEVSAGIVIRF